MSHATNLRRIYDNLALAEKAERERRATTDRAMHEIRVDLYKLAEAIPAEQRGTLQPSKPPAWQDRRR